MSQDDIATAMFAAQLTVWVDDVVPPDFQRTLLAEMARTRERLWQVGEFRLGTPSLHTLSGTDLAKAKPSPPAASTTMATPSAKGQEDRFERDGSSTPVQR